ncbi:hypothetical protein PsYK624_050120 [Phanerochaete sordida]|uniref:Uncharacterized protein n=1 Tax=Phanerochaete sordida TaxID=48140 RepID=A0A9P3G7M4_9APHY|nr:hypothetical protein PsYK624_050120 [Phanerochaete sordida]
MFTPAPHVLGAAHHDAAHFVPRIDLKTISEAEARTLMSVELKALGYRPSPGSLAAEAQAEAAKHPRTAAQRSWRCPGAQDYVRRKALGHRLPPGSLASQAQSASAKHPNCASLAAPSAQMLTRAALEGATALESVAAAEIDLNFIGEVEARKLMSEKHKALGHRVSQSPTSEPELNLEALSADEARALQSEEQKVLGYRPPAASLAAQAQSVVDRRADDGVPADAQTVQSEESQVPEQQPAVDGGARTFGELGL